MAYFDKIKEGDKVFGLVFGPGIVQSVWTDSYYTFEVMYDYNHQVVPYTDEGIPAWIGKLDFQTVYFKEDIDLLDHDIGINEDELLTCKKIIKLRHKKRLEVKCPSGIWQPVDKCPRYVSEGYLEDNRLHLFRKTPKESAKDTK